MGRSKNGFCVLNPRHLGRALWVAVADPRQSIALGLRRLGTILEAFAVYYASATLKGKREARMAGGLHGNPGA